MLKTLRFLPKEKNYRKRIKKIRTFRFERTTALVGPNGCGKSTVIRAIKALASAKKNQFLERPPYIETEVSHSRPLLVFDAERDNPRMAGMISSSWNVISQFRSHGETMRCILGQSLEELDGKKMIIVLDEPEAALDFDGLMKFARLMQSRQQHQFIIATHHPILWRAVDKVIEFEKGYRQRVEQGLREAL